MSRFWTNTFTEGNYKSDYVLEIRARITEVYVYCDIACSSLMGDVSSPVLKIIPIASEWKSEISCPIYMLEAPEKEPSFVQMPFTRIEKFILISGFKSITIPNAVNGVLPIRMV
ncbi:hypothetical protein NPIL_327711 [Nephila pilipes]|uniref:Uncharacterized protein n=1 Tax=Nephila pilipes TaxID=299642 RepID=A0A8X6ULA1_NEPPI|nr:hypothetical protein NPIL_327711 [Nephila pilipes]